MLQVSVGYGQQGEGWQIVDWQKLSMLDVDDNNLVVHDPFMLRALENFTSMWLTLFNC